VCNSKVKRSLSREIEKAAQEDQKYQSEFIFLLSLGNKRGELSSDV
jgi:hypothetical protein